MTANKDDQNQIPPHIAPDDQKKDSALGTALDKKTLEAIVFNSSDGIVIVTDGLYTYVNPALERMLEKSSDEIIGNPLGTFLDDATKHELLTRYENRQKGQPDPDPIVTGKVQTASGKQLCIEISIAPLHSTHPNSVLGTIRDITDRTQAERVSYEANQKMHWYSKNSPLGFIEWSADMTILDWNETASKIFGYTKSECLGKNGFDLIITPKDRQYCKKLKQKILNNSGGYEAVNDNVTKSGRQITCQWYNTPILSPEGETQGLISLVSDITDSLSKQYKKQISLEILEVLNKHKKTPATLRKIIALIKNLTSAQTTAIILQNHNSSQDCRCQNPEEISNCQTSNCFCPSDNHAMDIPDQEFLDSFLCRQVLAGQTSRIKKSYYTSFGSFWTENITELRTQDPTLGKLNSPPKSKTVALIPLKHGSQHVGLLYLADPAPGLLSKKDILFLEELASSIAISIAHRNAELIIEENERFFSDLFRLTTTGLLLTKTDGTIIDANTEFSQTVQKTKEELVGNNLKDLLTEKATDFFQSFKTQIKHDGCFGPIETELIHASANIIPVRISGVKITRDKKTYVWSTVVDMTAQRVSSEQLKEAKNMAENASKAKSQFLANMSHEIRTPMNAVIGFTDLLRNTSLNVTQREYVDTVYESSERLICLINTILDVSKLETSQMSLENVEFDMEYLLGNMVKTILPHVKEKNLKVSYSYGNLLPKHFKGDPTRIRQVVLNLLNNAVKFTPAGEIAISAKLQEKQLDGTMLVEISIKDTGIGIDEKTLPKIFSPFTQADNSSTRKFEGAGLGLYLVSSLMKMMGGKINATSKPGKGSRFFFELPLLPVTQTTTSVELLALEKLQKKTVFIIGQNPKTQQILEKYCTDFGLNVLRYDNPQTSILENLQNQHPIPDLIIFSDADCSPNFDISNLSGLEQTRTLLITSKAIPGSAFKAQQNKIDAYLSSPLLKTDLLTTIQAVLQTKKQNGASIITKHMLQEQTSRTQMRALIVESSHINTRLLETILTKINWKFDSVKDETHALKRARQYNYNIVLLDLMIPHTNLEQIVAQIQQATPTPIEIIGLSNAEPDLKKLAKAGINKTLSKPVKIMDLQRVFAELGLRSTYA